MNRITSLRFLITVVLSLVACAAWGVSSTGIVKSGEQFGSNPYTHISPDLFVQLCTKDADCWRWVPDRTITFDVTGNVPDVDTFQTFELDSHGGDRASFGFFYSWIELPGPNGVSSGVVFWYFLSLDGGPIGSTFLFDNAGWRGAPFNASSRSGGLFEAFFRDHQHNTAHVYSNAVGRVAVIPIPSAWILLLSSVVCIGLFSRPRVSPSV